MKKILSKELRKESFTHFLDPNVKPGDTSKSTESVESQIITNKHVELISKRINEMDTKDEFKFPYELKLLYNGSRDGFTSKNFMKFAIINLTP